MTKIVNFLAGVLGLGVMALTPAYATEFVVSDEVRARIEPVLKKSGGELTYFEGPSDMIGIGVSFVNGRQLVVYATPDGRAVFSGVAIDVETGQNLSNADLQKLPPPNYEGLVDMVANAKANTGRELTMFTEGNPESTNRYFVFVDPKCPYCHKTYDAFLKLMADGHDMVVHYIPVGILGPESENIAKEMVAMEDAEALELMRKLTRREPHLSDQTRVGAGNEGHSRNLALFRQLQFDAVPVVISDVSGTYNVRRGAIASEVLEQELRVAAVQKLASAK
jgi:thiol:disulfide interchange protein DsbG